MTFASADEDGDYEDEEPMTFTDDIDPEDFFASLKDKLRENIETEDEEA